CGLVQRLEKSLLVEVRFRLHQLLVDVPKKLIRAERKRVMNGFVDRVVGVATRAIDVRNGVTSGAGDAGLGSGMFLQVKIRIVERAAEKWNHVMTSGAPARRFHAAIALQGYLARLAHAEQVRLVVERTEMMRAVEPSSVNVRVTLLAVSVHHQ